MPTLYILIVDEPGKEQWMKIFLTERDAAFFLAQTNKNTGTAVSPPSRYFSIPIRFPQGTYSPRSTITSETSTFPSSFTSPFIYDWLYSFL